MRSVSAPSARLSSAAADALKVSGTLIRQARVARRLSRDELAQRLLMGRSTIERIEAGAPEVAIGFFVAVGEAVGVAVLAPPDPAALLASTAARARARKSAKYQDWF
ncbi:MAG TPA: helix-turn-helix transcriptional regulator [Solimonas sp.]|nr:helix-turn-helix transcriptional regulator [Solimonas sp.]